MPFPSGHVCHIFPQLVSTNAGYTGVGEFHYISVSVHIHGIPGTPHPDTQTTLIALFQTFHT